MCYLIIWYFLQIVHYIAIVNIGMQWEEADKRRVTAEFNGYIATIKQNYPTTSDVQSATQEITGAADIVTRKKSTIATNIENAQRVINNIQSLISTTDVTTIKQNIDLTNERIKANANKIASDKTILNIRKAQSESLKERYAGNYHSSWLGLWRPLSETGRIALFVLSIIFGLVTVIIGVYMYYTGINLQNKGGYGFFSGGGNNKSLFSKFRR
jgi:hypothetical protein